LGRVDVSRVGSGTGTTFTGTGIPNFTRKEHAFHDFGARTFLFLHGFLKSQQIMFYQTRYGLHSCFKSVKH